MLPSCPQPAYQLGYCRAAEPRYRIWLTVRVLEGNFPPGGRELNLALEHNDPATLLLLISQPRLEIEEPELQALVKKAAENPDAAMLYSDFFAGSRQHIRPLIPYQNGSIRDDFFFGPLQLYCREKIARALRDHGPLTPGTCTGLYELRLKVSCVGPVRHVAEPIGFVPDEADGQQGHFAYVDPSNLKRQQEMEEVATAHLERIGALCRSPARISTRARKAGRLRPASLSRFATAAARLPRQFKARLTSTLCSPLMCW